METQGNDMNEKEKLLYRQKGTILVPIDSGLQVLNEPQKKY